MAHFWIHGEAGWDVNGMEDGGGIVRAGAQVMEVGGEWVLFCAPWAGVRVNGLRPGGGLHVLSDRDEISGGDGRVYFSTERLAEVEAHLGSAVRCPRCKREVAEGAEVVRCPGCRATHHLACWTYGPHCTLCAVETAMDAGYRWTPEDL